MIDKDKVAVTLRYARAMRLIEHSITMNMDLCEVTMCECKDPPLLTDWQCVKLAQVYAISHELIRRSFPVAVSTPDSCMDTAKKIVTAFFVGLFLGFAMVYFCVHFLFLVAIPNIAVDISLWIYSPIARIVKRKTKKKRGKGCSSSQ